MAVANQKTVLICKEPCNYNNTYTTINLAALEQAMRDLTNAQFKVWIYFAKNRNGYEFDLSPALANECGIAKSTMQETVRFFIEKGYLVKWNNKSNNYVFREKPI